VRIEREAFERLVQDALMDVPEPFATELDRVAVVIEERAPAGHPALYGLYLGVPLDHPDAVAGALPPRIAVFMHPMADDCADADELREEVRITVLHELGHHLGLDEDRLHELGYG
jgi:predicted Zn-dependent protease with MMP-like domain